MKSPKECLKNLIRINFCSNIPETDKKYVVEIVENEQSHSFKKKSADEIFSKYDRFVPKYTWNTAIIIVCSPNFYPPPGTSEYLQYFFVRVNSFYENILMKMTMTKFN